MEIEKEALKKYEEKILSDKELQKKIEEANKILGMQINPNSKEDKNEDTESSEEKKIEENLLKPKIDQIKLLSETIKKFRKIEISKEKSSIKKLIDGIKLDNIESCESDEIKIRNEYINNFKETNNSENKIKDLINSNSIIIKTLGDQNQKNKKEILYNDSIINKNNLGYSESENIELLKMFGTLKEDIVGINENISKDSINYKNKEKEIIYNLNYYNNKKEENIKTYKNLNLNFENTKKIYSELNFEKNNIKNKIDNLNKLINDKNSSEEELVKLKKLKSDLEKKLKNYKKLIISYKESKKNLEDIINSLKERLENNTKNIKSLLKKQEDNTNDFNKSINENQIKLKEKINDYRKLFNTIFKNTKFKKLDVSKEAEIKIKKMLIEAEKYKLENKEEYENFHKVVKDVFKDGKILESDFNFNTANELVSIKKAFKLLKKANEKKEEVKKSKVNLLIKNFGEDKDLVNLLNRFKENKTEKELKDFYSLVKNFSLLKELIGKNVNPETNPTYIKFRKKIVNELKSNSSSLKEINKEIVNYNRTIHKEQGISNIFILDKKIIKNELGEIKNILSFLEENKDKLSKINYNKLLKIIKNYNLVNYKKNNFENEYIRRIRGYNFVNIDREETVKITNLKLILESLKYNLEKGNGEINELFENLKTKKELCKEIKSDGKLIVEKIKNKNKGNNNEISKILLKKISTISEKSSIDKLRQLKDFFLKVDDIVIVYDKLEKLNILGKNKEKINELKKQIKLVLEGGVIPNSVIHYFNNSAIDLGIDKEQLDKTTDKIQEKELHLADDEIEENYKILYQLKGINKLLYLKILGQVKGLTGDDLKNSLKLWNKIIYEKSTGLKYNENSNINYIDPDKLRDLYSGDFNQITKEKIKELASKNGEIAFTFDEAILFVNEGLNEKSKEKKFHINPEKNRLYRKKALLLLNIINEGEESWLSNISSDDLSKAKKLILFALKTDSFGDIRIINKLRTLTGENSEKLKEITQEQLALENKFSEKPYKDNMLKTHKKGDINLLSEISIEEFKKKFTEAINKEDNGESLKKFIGENPLATSSFFKYFIDKGDLKTLSIKDQVILGKMYLTQLSERGDTKPNKFIIQAQGGTSFDIEMQNTFGPIGMKKLIKQIKDGSLTSEQLKQIMSLKENIIKNIHKLGLSPEEKKDLISLLENPNVTVEEIKEVSKKSEKIINYKNALSEVIGDKLNDGKNKENFLKGLNEYLEKKDIDVKGLQLYLKENIKSNFIEKISNELVGLNIFKEAEKVELMQMVYNHQATNEKKETGKISKETVEKANKNLYKFTNLEHQLNEITTIKNNKENIGTITENKLSEIKKSEKYKKEEKKIEEKSKNFEINENSSVEEINKQIEKNRINSDVRSLKVNKIINNLVEKNILKKDSKIVKKISKSAQKSAKKILKIAKENPESSEDLRKTLKDYKKSLEEKGDLTVDERKTLDGINRYDLDDPHMPVKVMNLNKSEIKEKIKNSKNNLITIDGKKYVASGNLEEMALLDNESGSIVFLENDGFEEEVKLTEKEKDKIGKDPEGIGSFADFRRMMTELNIDGKIWDMRETIFTQIQNINPSFGITEKEYLSTTNTIFFLNTILKVTGKKTTDAVTLSSAKIHFNKENFNTGGISDIENVNIYGDSEIESIFIEEYNPRGNVLGFNILKFKRAMGMGLEKVQGIEESEKLEINENIA